MILTDVFFNHSFFSQTEEEEKKKKESESRNKRESENTAPFEVRGTSKVRGPGLH